MISKYELSGLLVVAKEYELYTMLYFVKSVYSTIIVSIMNEQKECNDNDTVCLIFFYSKELSMANNSRDTRYFS